jgi:glutamine---fructose-6-phosphate transaminase (isomerizing)
LSNSQQRNPSDGGQPSKAPGAYSLAEILSQPECWNSCLSEVRGSGILEQVRDRFNDCAEFIFVGCGSSYYVALCAAATMTTVGGFPARAVPASELVLYPELILSESKRPVPVLISRSGQTSEVLQAAELLRARSIPTLAISCVEGQTLERLTSMTIALPAADEKSTVMTRSFTSMLLVLQAMAATVRKRSEILELFGKIPALATPAFADLPEKIRAFVAQHRFADYVCLGQGPFFGLACEYALKVTEMSVSYAQAFHTLEFRHGPKSIVAPETLLVFLLSEQRRQAECDMLEEMKALGGTTLVIANHADKRARAAADLLVDLPIEAAPEITTLAPMLVTGQLLGLYTGLKKNLDPDSPRNLSRAVILNKPSTTPEHAAL